MRLVDADIVIQRIKAGTEYYSGETAGDFDKGRRIGMIDAAEKVADEAAKVAVRPLGKPVKYGEWERHTNFVGNYYICSACKYVAREMPECMGEPIYNFCPDCGAEMSGVKT